MRVIGFLRRSVNEARIRRRVLWLELLDRFKIGRVGHDFRKLLQLLQLIQFCLGLLLLNDSSAHDKSSLFLAKLKTYAGTKDRQRQTRPVPATRGNTGRRVEG